MYTKPTVIPDITMLPFAFTPSAKLISASTAISSPPTVRLPSTVVPPAPYISSAGAIRDSDFPIYTKLRSGSSCGAPAFTPVISISPASVISSDAVSTVTGIPRISAVTDVPSAETIRTEPSNSPRSISMPSSVIPKSASSPVRSSGRSENA